MTEIRPLSAASQHLLYNQAIGIDTSLAYALTNGSNSQFYREAIKFTNDIAKIDAFIVVTVKTIEEIYIKTTSELIHSNGSARKSFFNSNQNAGQMVSNRVEIIKNLLNQNPAILSDPMGQIDNSVLERANEIVTRYNLEWGDATIFSLVEQLKLDGFASCDYDFTRVIDSNIPIYIPQRLYQRHQNEISQANAPSVASSANTVSKSLP
ncbi:MAG TPA: hypothetical protein DDZ91_01570 [Firmicutes bacterium]|nr:hypothetical protein [Bacillota bacterium]